MWDEHIPEAVYRYAARLRALPQQDTTLTDDNATTIAKLKKLLDRLTDAAAELGAGSMMVSPMRSIHKESFDKYFAAIVGVVEELLRTRAAWRQQYIYASEELSALLSGQPSLSSPSAGRKEEPSEEKP